MFNRLCKSSCGIEVFFCPTFFRFGVANCAWSPLVRHPLPLMLESGQVEFRSSRFSTPIIG